MIFLILFIAVPLAEIATFIVVGQQIGLWPTLATVVVTAIAGTGLLRAQGFAVLQRVGHSLQQNRLPVSEVFHGACLLIAGALLLTPGFLTDAIGFAMFVPALRNYLGRALFAWLMRSGRTGDWLGGQPFANRRPEDEARVIDADFVDIDPDQPPGEPPPPRDGAS